MNAFSEANISVALRLLDNALAKVEEYTDTGDQQLIGSAYADLRAARGRIVAAEQLEELQSVVALAPTEPPPALRLVR